MKAAYSIAKREVFSYFVSPIAYVVTVVWLIWCGLQYYVLTGLYAGAPSLGASGSPLSAFFGGSVLFFIPLLVFAPVLTMRLLAEERHTGTLEPLLTAPVTALDVVLGKYAAAMIFWIALWIPTLLYVWQTRSFGPVDMGTVAASYLGVIGIGLYYMAIGLAMSALAKNQIVAALLSFMVLSALFVGGLLSYIESFAAQREVIDYISLWGHMQAFSKGIVDTRFLVFDVSVAFLFVYLAYRALEGKEMAVNDPSKASEPKASGRRMPAIDGWALLGSALVALLVVLVNYVSFRRYERWDLTRDRIFTLSERTDKLLLGLDRPVDIYVFMGASEPTYQELRELVTRYKAKTTRITAHFVDPDREPTKFRLLSEKFGVRAGVGESGEATAELAALVVSGDKRWVINRDDLLEVDLDSLEGEGRNLKVKSVKTEQALSGALVQVTSGRQTRVCVTSGHGEWTLDAGGERGLLAVREELKRENIVVDELSTRGKAELPKECDAIYVLGPSKSFSPEESAALKRYLDAGGNVLLALDPLLTGEQLLPTGLEELTQAHGIGLDADVVVELDEQALLSRSPVEHFVVRNYGDRKIVRSFGAMHLPVVLNLARSLAIKEGSEAAPLLKSSDKAYGETGLSQLSAGDDLKAGAGDVSGPLVLAAAVDTKPPKKEGAPTHGGGRLVVIGDSDWLEPTLLTQAQLANIDLLASVTGYLCEREALVAIAPRKLDGQGMLITEEGFAATFWRVVVLMPLAVLALGVSVWLQRRQ